jgi:hypothetical protein
MVSSQGRKLRALILGTPDPFSMGFASGWALAGHEIAAIWFPSSTKNTDSYGRDKQLARTAPGVSMHGISAKLGVEILPIPKLMNWQEEAARQALKLRPDIVLSLMFTDRIPEQILDAFTGQVLNVHPSILPAYRGRNVILNMLWDQAADRHGGLTIHLVNSSFDKGDILAQLPHRFDGDLPVSHFLMGMVKSGSLVDHTESKITPVAATLSPDMNLARGKWLCRVIPQLTNLRLEGVPRNLSVAKFVAELGKTTGEPPALSGSSLDYDFADGRARLEIKPVKI